MPKSNALAYRLYMCNVYQLTVDWSSEIWYFELWQIVKMQVKCNDVASDVGVNLCNVKSCLHTSNNEIFTDKRGDLPCVNISKHTCPVVK